MVLVTCAASSHSRRSLIRFVNQIRNAFLNCRCRINNFHALLNERFSRVSESSEARFARVSEWEPNEKYENFSTTDKTVTAERNGEGYIGALLQLSVFVLSFWLFLGGRGQLANPLEAAAASGS